MAHASSLAPWSFTPITTTSTDNLLSGLHIFQCKTAGCKRSQNCTILQVVHEDNSWREFPSSSESKLDMINNLLKITGKTCNIRRIEGLLLRLQMKCDVAGQSLQTTKEESCLVVKVAGKYQFGDAPSIGKYCSAITTIAVMTSKEMPSSTTVALVNQSTSSVRPTQVLDSLKYSVSTSLTDAYQTSSLAPSSYHTSYSAMLYTSQVGRTTATIQLETSSMITSLEGFMTKTITPSSTRSYDNEFKSVSSSFVMESNAFVTPPSNKNKSENNSITHREYLIISSAAAVVAVLFIALLVVVAVFLRRKKTRMQEEQRIATTQTASNEEQKVKPQCVRLGRSSSRLSQPIPTILKLKSIHGDETMDGSESDLIKLSDFWNPDCDGNDVYDIPADPPHLQRSLSSLYAKVDKSHKSNAAEDYYTVVGSKAGENTRDSDSICAIYDEPGDMMVYSQKAQTMEEGKENRSF